MTNLYDATLDEYDEYLEKMAEIDREDQKLEEEDFEESDFIL